jgi:hypothetical protein
MTRICFRILSWTIPVLLMSCGDKTGSNKPIRPVIFSIKTLINDQVKELKRMDFTIDKITLINDKKEEIFFKPDSGFWNREFEIFLTADIGKPSMRDRYNTHESDSAGYHLINYESLDPATGGTKFMTLYMDSLGILKEIKILYQEYNFMYQSNRILRMKFSRASSLRGNIINFYGINGYQKIIFRDPMRYEIEANLTPAK